MILYIWKIIDLPSILINELIYKVSFDLFLFSPKDATNFVKRTIQKGYIISSRDDQLSLSEELALELRNWQKLRREEISKKVENYKSLSHFEDSRFPHQIGHFLCNGHWPRRKL